MKSFSLSVWLDTKNIKLKALKVNDQKTDTLSLEQEVCNYISVIWQLHCHLKLCGWEGIKTVEMKPESIQLWIASQ